MRKNEKALDIFISRLLDLAEINYTPNGSNIKEINDALKTASKKGTKRVGFPEFVGKSGDFIIVIENKAEVEKQVKYVSEEVTEYKTDTKSLTDFAENGAYHYAKHIIENTNFKKVFAFGCSGNEKHHIIKPIYLDESQTKQLDSIENFENFSVQNIDKFYREQVLLEIPPEELKIKELKRHSEILHEALRNYGQLGDKEKPLVVSAILLALQDENFEISNLKGNKTQTDGNKIFTSIENYFNTVKVEPEVKKNQVLNQFLIIKDRTLLNQKDERLTEEIEKNVYLEKTPLRYFTEYIQTNILNSVKENVSEDVLGSFYGEFMRYSGGDGQSLGVILTPTHILELFCDLADLKPTDNVFDPCCGTSGFLISAMHKMLMQVKTKAEEIDIKKNRLHGVEIREDMFAIATTNMILRGDGKSNLKKDDFLRMSIEKLQKGNYSVGFMNPPYSQAKGSDTAHLSEICFIEHLLDGLGKEARCLVIVPQSTMVGKTKNDKNVKKRILENHTLEGVITLNKETFYGVGTNPCIAIFTAHKSHSENKFCKFINFENDGFIVRKHVGLVETERAKERKAHLLNCWLYDAPAETKFMVKTTIEPEDEWLHSFYYFNDEIPKDNDFEKTIADYLTFEFNMIMQGKSYLFENEE